MFESILWFLKKKKEEKLHVTRFEKKKRKEKKEGNLHVTRFGVLLWSTRLLPEKKVKYIWEIKESSQKLAKSVLFSQRKLIYPIGGRGGGCLATSILI